MEIGRNEPCPCNSGKKYKKCHGSLEEQPLLDPTLPIDSAINKRMNEARIKQCIHPKTEECQGKIVVAHSIQNNRILNKIGRNGEVYMLKHTATKTSSRTRFKLVGRGQATTFTGFCSYHDKSLFQPIEDTAYQGTEQQQFLFAYRTFAFEYHKKLEAKKAITNASKIKPSLIKDDYFLGYMEGHDLAIRDIEYHKQKFDEALIQGQYGIVETLELKFEGESPISVCSGFFLEYELNGKPASCLPKSDEMAKLLMFNVIPQEGHMVVLFSWLYEYRDIYKDFREQLLSLTPTQQLQVINNIIPAYCENVVYNPDYIDGWEQSQKEEFERKYHSNLRNPFVPEKRNLLSESSHNLFKGITVSL